jgi:membrane fusion protein, heavy metal efflux system
LKRIEPASASQRGRPFIFSFHGLNEAMRLKAAGRGTAFMIRMWLVIAGIAGGILLTSLAPPLVGSLRSKIAALPGMAWLMAEAIQPSAARDAERYDHHHDEGPIKLRDGQIEAAGIEIQAANAGVLSRRRLVPGLITPNGDRIARVAVRLLGTVVELRKRLGDPVERNEVVAVIESREVADAKSEYLAARLTDELQQTLFARATSMWQAKVKTENDYLRARTTAQDARVKFDSAQQKLFTLGLSEEQIAALPNQPAASLRLQEVRSPIAGRIAERRVDLGALVGREGQESELYVVVDLSELWVDLAVSPADLPAIREDQEITVAVGPSGERAQARIMFISPLLDRDTRTARVVASLANPDHIFRPGSFVTAEIPLSKDNVDVVVSKAALQTIKGDRVVFVRNDHGFEVRKVSIGREDDRAVEIVSGLSAGETIAINNTFILKAELGKAEAEHQD